MRFYSAVCGLVLLGGVCASHASYAKELAQSSQIEDDSGDKAGVTSYMACKDFKSLIRDDYERAKRNHSLDSNRVLERHTAQMMVLLQPYAVTGPDGHPLDFVWGYLVRTLDEWCTANPNASLDDGVRHAGAAMLDAIRHAREMGKKDQSVEDKPAYVPETPELPPSSILSPELPGPDPAVR